MSDKQKRIAVFDENALAYDRYRPRYPAQLVWDIIALSELKKGDHILEIGCGTGQVSLGFLQEGFALTAIEKGKALADLARDKMRRFEQGHIIQADFEKWQANSTYNLAVSAQAFHWIEMESGIEKIAGLLGHKGSLALIWNVDISQQTAFWQKTSRLYNHYLPSPKGQSGMDEMINRHEAYLQSLLTFGPVIRKTYPWEKIYTKEDYMGLLSTFSPHMSMEKHKREQFFGEIEAIIEQQGNIVNRLYRTELVFAQKKA